MTTVNVRFLASLRERFGVGETELAFLEGSTVRDLKEEIEQRYRIRLGSDTRESFACDVLSPEADPDSPVSGPQASSASSNDPQRLEVMMAFNGLGINQVDRQMLLRDGDQLIVFAPISGGGL